MNYVKRGDGEPACKPGSVEGNHSSGIHVTVNLKRPTRKRTRIGAAPDSVATATAERAASLFGLAPGGVYHAGLVTKAAVRSYRTVSPLPSFKACAVKSFAGCSLFLFPY